MADASTEKAIRSVMARISAAWQHKDFEGLDDCFDENAVIVGPNYVPFAAGRKACADSYREFATNAAIVDYSENSHQLHMWPQTGVYTFNWQMAYTRDAGVKRESGTDQFVLGRTGEDWRVLFRYIYFSPSN
jgi:ketosteroid isomerase-like protein